MATIRPSAIVYPYFGFGFGFVNVDAHTSDTARTPILRGRIPSLPKGFNVNSSMPILELGLGSRLEHAASRLATFEPRAVALGRITGAFGSRYFLLMSGAGLDANIVYEVSRKPRVLVLHSYGTDYSWVTEVSEGINRVLAGKPYSMRWHYMDTKRHPDDAFKERAGQAARDVIEQWQPNVIVTVADNAQALVGKHYVNDPRFADLPMILETPKNEDLADDIANLAKLRGLIAEKA